MPLQASFTVLCFFISRLYGFIEIQNGRKKFHWPYLLLTLICLISGKQQLDHYYKTKCAVSGWDMP